MSRSCLGLVSVFFGDVSVLFWCCLGLVSVMSRSCLGLVLVLSLSCLGVVLVLSRFCLGNVSVMSRSCLGLCPFLVMCRCCFVGSLVVFGVLGTFQ